MGKYVVITERGRVMHKQWLDAHGFIETRSKRYFSSDDVFDLNTAKRLARLFNGKVVRVKADEKQ